jgi:hypothetical protein
MLELQKMIQTPLSDTDLERFLGAEVDSNIIKYSDLADYNDLDELLPYDKSYKIILIEYEKNNGHWICMCRYANTIEIFNSFGTKHDSDDLVHSNQMNMYLGQSKVFLNILLENELEQDQHEMVYNKVKFQEKDEQVNTCGRHVVNRLLCLLHYNMNLAQYIKFMKQSKEKTKLNYDEVVSLIIV